MAGGNSVPSHGDDGSGMFTALDGRVVEIRNVWASNLEEEMANIRDIIEKYPFIGMVRVMMHSIMMYCECLMWWAGQDTEFPGIVARPAQDYSGADITYQVIC